MIIININLTLAFFNTLDNLKNTRGTSLEQTFWFPISYPEFGINKLWCLTHSLYDAYIFLYAEEITKYTIIFKFTDLVGFIY